MDDDAERGLIFVLGVMMGLAAMLLIFTARGRRAAQQVFEAATDLADDFGDTATDVLKSVRR